MVEPKKERFFAFTFSRADLVLEIDANGVVTYAAGASQKLFQLSMSLQGASFAALVPPDCSPVRQEITEAAQKGKRLSVRPIDLAVGGKRVAGDIAGCAHPEHPGIYFLSFRAYTEAETKKNAPPTVKPPAVVDPVAAKNAAFAETAQRLARGAGGKKLSMTLLGVEGGDKISAGDREAMQASVKTMLRSFTADADGVAELADNRFGVVHDATVSGDLIREKVSGIVQKVSADLGVAASTVALRPADLSEEDAARALVFAINKFASQTDGVFTLNSLAEVMESGFTDAMGQVAEFRTIIQNKQFELYFQPIVDVKTAHPHHQEALCRFADGKSPFSTVVFAEEAGLISDLDYYVTERGVETLLRNPGALDIAVNMSGRSLETPRYVAAVSLVLERLGSQRGRLLIEITESSRIQDMEKVNNVVERFRALGHKVCIDDFGSGAAAFDYLRAINVDVVKIDGKFIRDLPKSVRDQTFVRAIHAMCSQLKCQTVAEMVEGPEHAKVLRDIGIDHAQGYFYAKPSPQLGMRQGAVQTGAASRLKIA